MTGSTIDRFFILFTTKDAPSPDRFDGTIYWFDLRGSVKLAERVRRDGWLEIEEIAERLHDEPVWVGSDDVIAYSVHGVEASHQPECARAWIDQLTAVGFVCGDLHHLSAEAYMNRFHPETNLREA